MITRILEMKDFGRYLDFTWDEEKITDFKKYNLIYGWNRSGKTTLSRVFSSCEKRCTFSETQFPKYPENGKYKIKLDDSKTITDQNVQSNEMSILVFNEDFVNENISFDNSSSCEPIIILSKEDIETQERIDELSESIQDLEGKYKISVSERDSQEKAINNFYSDLGRQIKDEIFDGTYNKTKVEAKINEIGIDNFKSKILNKEDQLELKKVSRDEPPQKIQTRNKLSLNVTINDRVASNLDEILKEVNIILSTKITSQVLDYLRNDVELNSWVEQGLKLHNSRGKRNECLFCGNEFDEKLLNKLSGHFDKNYSLLKENILKAKTSIEGMIQPTIDETNTIPYQNLKEKYEGQIKEINTSIRELNSWFQEILNNLDEKYNNPFEKRSLSKFGDDFLNSANRKIDILNKIIADYNQKVDGHEDVISNAKDKIELHMIANSLSGKNLDKDLSALSKKISETQSILEEKQEKERLLYDLQKKVSNIGLAIDSINQYLKEFFGREEITITLDDSQTGYYINNNGTMAKCLSEGEKTAIGFAYFLVKTKEKNFDLSNSIIFIDDPISSFDSNYIYHCYSLIINHFNNVLQLFISTHNFQFFNLIKGWFLGKRNHEEKCGFYMIENDLINDERHATIAILDETLKKNKSEYQFLFNLLFKFDQPNSSNSYKDLYTIGNIARRFFDIFTDFKIPDSRDQKSKMEEIIKEINNKEGSKFISDVDSNKAYKLINEYSHNSDPTSSMEHKNKGEIRDAVHFLLKIVEKSDPIHFSTLTKSVQ